MSIRNIGEKVKKMRMDKGLSQQDLANVLKISRVSISQIESNKRQLMINELIQLSQLFNISLDEFLNLSKSHKVQIVPEKEKTFKKQEMRISIPQKNINKFKQVLLYILNKIGSKPNIGETVIYKLLYFIDFNYYERYEEQLIGATYIKNHHGPTPIEFKKLIDQMIRNKEIVKVKDQYFQYPQTKYLPRVNPDLSILKANEIELINDVLYTLSDKNATQISEYSHEDVPWKYTKDNEIIDYEAVFYRTPEYSVREYSKESRDG